jgi:hypothetical protein
MLRRLARILFVGYSAIVLAQQTNLGPLAFGDECRDDCPDETTSGRCPLNCTSCACVGHGTPVSLTMAAPLASGPVVDRIPRDEPKKLPDPTEDAIFHVPRSLSV